MIKGVKPQSKHSRGFRQGYYKPENKEKYAGLNENIIYRSSWEYVFMVYCDRNPNVLSWNSEQLAIPYKSPLDKREHMYYIDFSIKLKKDDKIVVYLVEIKPKSQLTKPKFKGKFTEKKFRSFSTAANIYLVNEAKFKAADSFAKQHGFEFIVITEDHLFGKNRI